MLWMLFFVPVGEPPWWDKLGGPYTYERCELLGGYVAELVESLEPRRAGLLFCVNAHGETRLVGEIE